MRHRYATLFMIATTVLTLLAAVLFAALRSI
jgi:hypothetical protein